MANESESESHSVGSNSLRPQGLHSPWEFSRPEYWSGQPFPCPGDLPNPGTQPRSPTLQADSLPTEPQGKPKNTGVGSLSLLQRIFQTQEFNWDLLHCRQILYQLSYQGSPHLPHCKSTFKSLLHCCFFFFKGDIPVTQYYLRHTIHWCFVH